MSFSEVGPIIDGHVEIPLSSGRRYAADGMLSSHPDYPRLKEISAAHGVDIGHDVPLVLDMFAPLGMLYYLGNVGFVKRRGMKIDRVFTVTPETAQKVLNAMADWRVPSRTAPIGLESGEALSLKATGLSGWLPDEDERKRIEGMPLETWPNARPLNVIRTQVAPGPCYMCDGPTTGTTNGVSLCAGCRESP